MRKKALWILCFIFLCVGLLFIIKHEENESHSLSEVTSIEKGQPAVIFEGTALPVRNVLGSTKEKKSPLSYMRNFLKAVLTVFFSAFYGSIRSVLYFILLICLSFEVVQMLQIRIIYQMDGRKRVPACL